MTWSWLSPQIHTLHALVRVMHAWNSDDWQLWVLSLLSRTAVHFPTDIFSLTGLSDTFDHLNHLDCLHYLSVILETSPTLQVSHTLVICFPILRALLQPSPLSALASTLTFLHTVSSQPAPNATSSACPSSANSTVCGVCQHYCWWYSHCCRLYCGYYVCPPLFSGWFHTHPFLQFYVLQYYQRKSCHVDTSILRSFPRNAHSCSSCMQLATSFLHVQGQGEWYCISVVLVLHV